MAEAARFLQQAQFSTDADIAAVQAKGYAAWLDEQMSARSYTSGWDWLVSQGYRQYGIRFNQHYADHMIWNQFIAAPDAVRKRVALAWSEISWCPPAPSRATGPRSPWPPTGTC